VEDNTFAALRHSDRICQLDLDVLTPHLDQTLEGLQEPLPALTYLSLRCEDDSYGTALRVPASFLGGCAPRLQELELSYISFPALPTLLLSATQLVKLSLWRIPHSGYFSPEAMATCLPALTRLETLHMTFRPPQDHPDPKSRRSTPQTRTLLPVLTKLWFKGVSEYLEGLVAGIDAPLLNELGIFFFHQLIFDTPELAQFISRSPNFDAHDEARVRLSNPWEWHYSLGDRLSQTLGGTLHLRMVGSWG
jgi:hypothetical protein